MFEKILWVAAVALFIHPESRACDVCGCAGSAPLMGFHMPGIYHRVGIDYRFQGFQSSHPDFLDPNLSIESQEVFRTANVFGRYAINSRWALTARIPYVANTRRSETGELHPEGLGDVSILGEYRMLYPEDMEKDRHTLVVSLGLKAPTGKWNSGLSSQLSPLSLSAGTGSWDILAGLYYRYAFPTWGIQAQTGGSIAGTNDQDYGLGSFYSGSLTAYRPFNFTQSALDIIPQVGLAWDRQMPHHYPEGSYMQDIPTGGHYGWVKVATDLLWKDWGLRISADFPVVQEYAFGEVNSRPRLQFTVFYQFYNKIKTDRTFKQVL